MHRGASRKESQQYVSRFRHCRSFAKRPWELAYYNSRACACSSIILSTCRTQWLDGQCLHQGLFPISSSSRTAICWRVPTRRGGHHVALRTKWNVSVVFFSKNKKKHDEKGTIQLLQALKRKRRMPRNSDEGDVLLLFVECSSVCLVVGSLRIPSR